MILSNVDIGSGPGLNDGESLYSAFNKVNQNFANVQSNVNNLTNSVTSVAGRTGNVVLTINDVLGFQGLNLVSSSAPTHSNSSGTKGQVIVSSGNVYICTAANTWVYASVVTSF